MPGQVALGLSAPALPDTVGLLRGHVARFAERCRPHGIDVSDVRLAASEALSNVVVHAYPSIQGDVGVRGFVDEEGDLVVVVLDDGIGMGAAAPSPGLGLGMRIVRSAASRVEVTGRAPHRGTAVTLHFAAAADQWPAAAADQLAAQFSPRSSLSA